MRSLSVPLLLVFARACIASSPESAPEVDVCLHFRAETASLEPDSEERLNTFSERLFERTNSKPIPQQYELHVNGIAEKSPTLAQLNVVADRHRLLFDFLVAKAGTGLENANSSLSSTRSKYISIKGPTLKEPGRPLEICDARIAAFYPVEAKPAICGKQYGHCALHCSAESCDLD
jgi:hypothetical protein